MGALHFAFFALIFGLALRFLKLTLVLTPDQGCAPWRFGLAFLAWPFLVDFGVVAWRFWLGHSGTILALWLLACFKNLKNWRLPRQAKILAHSPCTNVISPHFLFSLFLKRRKS